MGLPSSAHEFLSEITAEYPDLPYHTVFDDLPVVSFYYYY